jgi:hypothetical protein
VRGNILYHVARNLYGNGFGEGAAWLKGAAAGVAEVGSGILHDGMLAPQDL